MENRGACSDSAASLGGEISYIHAFYFPRRTWLITTSHCKEQGLNLIVARTTHVEDKHNVLIGGVFTLLCDVLGELFDYMNNKCASKNVFLKAFEAQI